MLIGFCRREQGFLVAPGNPLKIGSIEDVLATARAHRHAAEGRRRAIAAAVAAAPGQGLARSTRAVGPVCPTGPDIAQAIRAGRADTGIATRSVANAAGLDFVSIVWEPFDLVMRQRDYFHPPLQALFKFLRSDELAARAQEMGGFDLRAAGSVRFVN